MMILCRILQLKTICQRQHIINISENENTIRWFSPTKEVDLCGHATLASAFVYFNYINTEKDTIEFKSKWRNVDSK